MVDHVPARGHKAPGDFVAGTYVIDSIFQGRLIIEELDGLYVGPPSVTREEADKYLKEQALVQGYASGFVPPSTVQSKNGEPFLDKTLDTYVVWNHKQSVWLAFNKNTGVWQQIQ